MNLSISKLATIAEFEHLGEVKLEIGVELFEDEKEKIIDMISDMFNDIIVSSEVVTVQNTELPDHQNHILVDK